MPLEDQGQQSQGQAPQSFVERKAAQLSTERDSQGPDTQRAAPDQDSDLSQAPDLNLESAELDDGYESAGEDDQQHDLDDEQQGELADSDDLDDQAPEGQHADDLNSDPAGYEKRYKDLQSEVQHILESKSANNREHAESMGEHLKMRFSLEDQLTEAASRVEFLKNTMEGNAQRFQNIDWSKVPPEKVQEVQAQAQQAFMMQQQAQTTFNQVMEQVDTTRETVKKREAEIAKIRLRRSIPNWDNKTYGELRNFAVESGMPPEAFNDITDPVIIEWAHNAMIGSKAQRSVQVKKKKRSQPPRGRSARASQRNDRGQYAKKQTEPNQRGSFADKHKHRLANERRQGR
tara:strand:- start:6008 stop:7045 length:1038 start_codon:yes stop_codon:yes gene_type:complete